MECMQKVVVGSSCIHYIQNFLLRDFVFEIDLIRGIPLSATDIVALAFVFDEDVQLNKHTPLPCLFLGKNDSI